MAVLVHMMTSYPDLQLQSQARRQPAPEQTGSKPGSVAGVKQISVGVADQVSKATEIPTIKTIDVKQPVTDEKQLDDHPQKEYTIDGVTPSATAIQSVPGIYIDSSYINLFLSESHTKQQPVPNAFGTVSVADQGDI